MSLRKRRGELRGDTLGDVASLGGSSSRRICSLKVRMQGSGSGALSSFDDMLMDVADGAGTISLCRPHWFFFSVKIMSCKSPGWFSVWWSSYLPAVHRLSRFLALEWSFACALSATDTLRGGFVSTVTPASWEKKKHTSLSVLCKHDLPSPTPFYLLLCLIGIIWLLLDVDISTPLHFTHAFYPTLVDLPVSLTFPKVHTHTSFFLHSAPGTSSINLEGSWQHLFSRHHPLRFLLMLLYMRSLHTHNPFQHKFARRAESRERKTPEKALQGGTPKSVASGSVFIENKQHN